MTPRGRIKPIAPPTLIALALVMAAGVPMEVVPQVTAATAIEHARVLREDRDGEQVARLIKAINAATHHTQPRQSMAVAMNPIGNLAAALVVPPQITPVPAHAPPGSTADGRLHLIDLPPPALRA